MALRLVRCGLLAVVIALAAPARADEAADAALWADLKEAVFADRPILDGAGVIGLEAPYRAEDAAIVPIRIDAALPQTPERYIKTVTLIIDKNPAPVAATFHMTPRTGDASIATRVRVNEYTTIRAVAETNDGQLYMAEKFVKAAGGCSAPALKDQDQAMANLGKLKFKQTPHPENEALVQAQLLISHPNYSGLQMDQITRNYIPAHYVERIEVREGGEAILQVEGGISLSENPSITFSFEPVAGDVAVEARDTEGNIFGGTWPVEQARSGS